MRTKNTARTRLMLSCAALVAAVAVAACGSTSTNTSAGGSGAQSLLRQTFASGHQVKSGVLGFSLTIDPSGSTLLTTPITASLSGPFQSHGTGKLPSSDFTVRIAALGKQGSLGIISTGTAGYLTLQGSAYQLPRAQFERLEQSFSSAGGGGAGHGGLAGLGIDPQRWLQNPTIVGSQVVNGVRTTHLRAGVNAAALLSDLSTFLSRTTKSAGISPTTQQKIAAAVHSATVDVWTGSADKILRRLTLSLTVPLSGQTSSALGGLRSAGIALAIQYADLNQPQTITAPAHALPYSQFTTKLQGALGALTGAVPGMSGGTSGSAPSSSAVTKYSKCIQTAGQDVAKMQKCASLLNGK